MSGATDLSPKRRHARQASTSPNLVLAMILACQLMFTLDTSVVVTALPKIRESLDFSGTGLSWVQNAYTLAFGGLLLLGARMGDIFGRRRVFTVGIGVFTAASLLAGLAPSATWLLVGRAAQGVAAAVAAPSTLALLLTTFKEPHPRARAIALYSSVSSGGSSVGLVLGGFLTTTLSWRWGLFINVPIGIAIVLLAPRYLPDTERHPGRFDLTGAATSTLGMTALVYGFVRAASDGWSQAGTVGSFVIGVGLLGAFIVTELRAEQPITPLGLFADRRRAGSYVSRLLMVGGMFSFFFFISQYLEGVRNYTPLGVGYAFLPLTLVMFSVAQVVPRLHARISSATLITGGAVVGLIAMAWLSRLSAGTQFFPNLVLPMVLLGGGIGVAFIGLTGVSVTGVAPKDEGAASGLVNVAQQVGGSLGLAVLVTVFGAASRRVAEKRPIGVGAVREAQLEMAHGTAAAITGSTIFIAVSLLVILLTLRGRVPAVSPPMPGLTADTDGLETLSSPL
jgi:EmrB/QacA subfamily drug resistance transporter